MIWTLTKEWRGGNKFIMAASDSADSLRGVAKDDYFKSRGHVLKWDNESDVRMTDDYVYILEEIDLV